MQNDCPEQSLPCTAINQTYLNAGLILFYKCHCIYYLGNILMSMLGFVSSPQPTATVNTMQENKQKYGVGETSYIASGKLEGIKNLVDAFYSNMDIFPEAEKIRKMHPQDLTESRKKLSYFLAGWLGGPRLYLDHYGSINIPNFHKPFAIGDAERDAWLVCMQKAIDAQPYQTSFKEYLFNQLKIPAQRIKETSPGY